MRRSLVASVGLACVLALTSCGDSGSGNDAGLVLTALGEVPTSVLTEDDGSGPDVFVVDLRAAADVNGAPEPSGAGDEEGHVEWFRAVEGATESPGPIAAQVPQFLRTFSFDFQALEDEIGFTAADVDWSVEAFGGPAQFTVLSGVEAKDGLTELEGGIRTIGEGEDLEIDIESANSLQLDRLGRPIRVAGRDGLTALSFSTPVLRDWVELEPADSLASVPAYADNAAALDGAGAVAAMVSPLGVSAAEAAADLGSGMQLDELRAQVLGESELPGPFSLVGIGWRADGKVTIAYGYDSESTATDNRDAIAGLYGEASTTLNEPLRDFLTVETVEVSGSVVVVTVSLTETTRPRIVLDMAVRREVIFWHE